MAAPESTKAKRPASKSQGPRLGSLRFGLHGVLGVCNCLLIPTALLAAHAAPTLSTITSSLAVVGTASTALSSIQLLDQVPKTSFIAHNIIPPHREAFKRTIAIVGYLDLRLAHELGWFDMLSAYRVDVFGAMLVLYNLWFFFPRGSFDNGNTWVFVVPMWLGISIDTAQQLKLALGMPTAWNETVVTKSYLLLTLLVALLVAFSFTLAFRKYIRITTTYWMAAACVFGIIAGMLV